MERSRLFRRRHVLVVALIAIACEQAVEPDGRGVARIEVDPSQATVSAGRTATLAARAFGANGEEMGPMPVFWSTQDAGVATVNQAGVVTGVAPGSTQIAASLNGRSGIATISVSSLPVAVVRVLPAESDVAIGKTLQLTTDALDGDGATLSGHVPAWTSSNAGVASVNASGIVTGVAAGTATIRATIDGVQGSALVRVVPEAVAQLRVLPNTSTIPQGDFVQLTATALDAQGNALPGRQVEWSSSDQSVAVVSSAGRVQSVSPGSATITGTCEGVSATAAITVTPVPVASVTITPANPSVIVGQSTPLSAVVRDGQGNVLNGRTVTWSSTATSIATVGTDGVLTGVALGTATIRAVSGGVTGTTTATVGAVPVAAVSVTPPSADVNVGATVQFAAQARDAQGNVLPGRTAAWSSNAPGIATVDNAGLVTGVAVGAATITANIGGITDAATVTVSAVPVASVTVTPNPAVVEERLTRQLTATLRDASGNTLSGRTVVWASSNPAVAGVSQGGLVTAIAPGSATITATAPNAGPSGSSPAGSTALTVTYAPVASVTVLPASASVQIGATTTFTATLRDASGQTLSHAGRTVAWSSLDPARATIDAATGVVTGVSSGATTIQASASSPGQSTPVNGSASLTVNNVPVASVTVVPGAATVHVGSPYARQFTAEPRDNAGNLLAGRNVVWTSSNQGVATVDAASGLVTGVAPGSATITATSEGAAGTAGVTVDLVPIASVTVSPPSATLSPPATQQLSAVPLDSAGNPVGGSALGSRGTAWTTSNGSVASVSTGGLVTAVASGSATITATIDGMQGTSAITVLGAAQVVLITLADTLFLPGSLAGTVLVTDAGGNPLPGVSVTLSSSSPSSATVSPGSATTDGSGLVSFTVTGVAQGTTTITATSGGASDTHLVRVLRPVASITFSPSSLTLSILLPSGSVTATARDAANNGLGNRYCTIVSNDPAIATVSPASATTSGNGRITITVTRQSPGQTSVSVTCEKVTSSFTVTVN